MKHLLFCAALLLGGLAPALAQAPRLIQYQGVLTNTSGTPVADGSYALTFRLYTTPSGGTAFWTEAQTVTTHQGVYNVRLGSVTPLSPSVMDFNAPYWLGLSVAGGAELTPRTAFASTPYALGLGLPVSAFDASTSPALRIEKTGADGSAAHFVTNATPNAAPALFSQTLGAGPAGYFWIRNPDNAGDALYALTDGTGSALYAENAGRGFGGEFKVTGATNPFTALAAFTNGIGPAGTFAVSNTASTSEALGVSHFGDGRAAALINFRPTNPQDVLYLATNGTGPLINAFKAGNNLFRFENDGTLNLYQDGTVVLSLNPDFEGDSRVITQELQITGGSDLSEPFDIIPADGFDAPLPGQVVSIDPAHPGRLRVSRAAYDRLVAGVVSGAGGIEPGVLMGQAGSEADGAYPVALTGRVYVYVDAAYGAVTPGDLLTPSDTPGHAMKATDYARAQGAVLGKALTALDAGRGLVLALVTLQ